MLTGSINLHIQLVSAVSWINPIILSCQKKSLLWAYRTFKLCCIELNERRLCTCQPHKTSQRIFWIFEFNCITNTSEYIKCTEAVLVALLTIKLGMTSLLRTVLSRRKRYPITYSIKLSHHTSLYLTSKYLVDQYLAFIRFCRWRNAQRKG